MSTQAHPSDHLINDRWPTRGDADTDVMTAWERAEQLDMSVVPRVQRHVPDHDEARFDQESQTVIFRRNNTLTTVYSVRPDWVTNIEGRSVRSAVIKQFGLCAVEGSEMMQPQTIAGISERHREEYDPEMQHYRIVTDAYTGLKSIRCKHCNAEAMPIDPSLINHAKGCTMRGR